MLFVKKQQSCRLVDYRPDQQGLGAPYWDRTSRVNDTGFTDPPATFYGIPTHIMEPPDGFEPSQEPYEDPVLPLYDGGTRCLVYFTSPKLGAGLTTVQFYVITGMAANCKRRYLGEGFLSLSPRYINIITEILFNVKQ